MKLLTHTNTYISLLKEVIRAVMTLNFLLINFGFKIYHEILRQIYKMIQQGDTGREESTVHRKFGQ